MGKSTDSFTSPPLYFRYPLISAYLSYQITEEGNTPQRPTVLKGAPAAEDSWVDHRAGVKVFQEERYDPPH